MTSENVYQIKFNNKPRPGALERAELFLEIQRLENDFIRSLQSLCDHEFCTRQYINLDRIQVAVAIVQAAIDELEQAVR